MPKILKLDGAKMQTEAALYDELTRVLALPAYFGRNLDALEECVGDLTDREREIQIVLMHGEAVLKQPFWTEVEAILRSNPKIHLVIENASAE